MTTYNIDWEGAYDAWKQSGLPRRRFQYSDLFKTFIGEGAMPSEDTVRTRFRSVRDQRGDHSPTTNITVAKNDQPPVTLDLSEPIKIFRLDAEKIQTITQELAPKYEVRNHSRQVVIRLPDGGAVEFKSKNAELFALKVLFCME